MLAVEQFLRCSPNRYLLAPCCGQGEHRAFSMLALWLAAACDAGTGRIIKKAAGRYRKTEHEEAFGVLATRFSLRL